MCENLHSIERSFVFDTFSGLKRGGKSDWREADVKDLWNHMRRTAIIVAELVSVGMDGKSAQIVTGALFHDIGKLVVPIRLFAKSRKEWTIEEKSLMKSHVSEGFELTIASFPEEARILVGHHEFQEDGYPRAKKRVLEESQDLRNGQKMVAISDQADSLLSERPYKKAWNSEEVLRYLLNVFNQDEGLVEKAVKAGTKID